MHYIGLLVLALMLAVNAVWQISQKRYIPRSMSLRTAVLAGVMLVLNITYALWPSLSLLLITLVPTAFVIVGLGAGARAYTRNGGLYLADATKARIRALMYERKQRKQMLENPPGS